MIDYEEYKEYCKFNPQAIDFMCRMTIGPYPLSDELQARLMEYQQAEMQKYYGTPMIQGEEAQQTVKENPGLAAQMAIAHANMVMATNPSNYHIVPLEDRNKKYSSLEAG